MGELIHTSHIKLVREEAPVRKAFIEDFSEPVTFGVHGKIASLYGVNPVEQYPTTLDHIIAGVGG